MTKRLDTLILSISPKCNLKCEYCHNDIYYSSIKQTDNMPLRLVHKAISDYADYLHSTSLNKGIICLSGGEPLLFGYDYIEQIILIRNELEKKYNLCLEIDLQTNGTLINDKWCQLFAKNNICLGISIDGNPQLTDRHRIFRDDKHKVSQSLIKSIELLNRLKINYGFLMVATSSSVGHEGDLLEYLCSLSPQSIAFTPCIDKGPKISPREYEEFLLNLFDTWKKRDKLDPEIRMFKYIRQKLTDCLQMPIPCEWGNDCPNCICVSVDGKVWVCDVYMGNSKGYLGDINNQTINEIVLSDSFKSVHNKVRSIPKECMSCEALSVCNGGCVYRRIDEKDYFCEAIISIFKQTKEYTKNQLDSISLTITDMNLSTAKR